VEKRQVESSGPYTVNYMKMCYFVGVKDASNYGVSKKVENV
jgi:hypothetical protein